MPPVILPPPDADLQAALRLIADRLGSQPVRCAPDRYQLITLEPEGVTRHTYASRSALLWIASRIRAHDEYWQHAHFWERWSRSDRFTL